MNKPSLFEDQNRSSKLNVYQEELKLLILNKKLRTDKEIYIHSLKSGFLPKHSKEVIINLIKENKIEKKSYKISSDSMKKDYKAIVIEII